MNNQTIAARMQFQYADGQEDAVDLGFGTFILGVSGGPADIPLQSKNLSRRHATIIVGKGLAECTVKDLGSTNKSAFIEEDGSLNYLEPQKIYQLGQLSELLFGDVGALFEYINPASSGIAESEIVDSNNASGRPETLKDVAEASQQISENNEKAAKKVEERSDTETKPVKAVDFSLPDTAAIDRLEVESLTSTMPESLPESKRPTSSDAKHINARPRSSATTATSATWVIHQDDEKIEHQLVYEHGREALGMDLPYDRELLWIAEMSLKMPLPEGWSQRSEVDSMEQSGGVVYFNTKMKIETSERPQTVLCRNIYRECKRKLLLEAAVGTVFEEEVMPRLLVVDRATGLDLFHYMLPGRNTLGKGFGAGKSELVDITLNSRACSRRHGYIEVREGRFMLMDLHSTNGTFIGELPNTASRRIEPGIELEIFDGQLIMFGDVECSLVAPAGASVFYPVGAVSGGTGQTPDDFARTPDLSRPAPRLPDPPQPQQYVQPVGAVAGAGGTGAVDYEAIRRIIREEISASAPLHPPPPPPPPAADEYPRTHPPLPHAARPEPASAGSLPTGEEEATGAGAGGEEAADMEAAMRRQHGRVAPSAPDAGTAQPARAVPPAGMGHGYDSDEEVRLAAELSAAEAAGRAAAGVPSAATGGQQRGAGRGRAPSKEEGFLAREEARRVRMLEWAKGHYRRQAPLDQLGSLVLPTGALHRVLARLTPVPHLLILACVCRALRRACYVTEPWSTVNGDRLEGLWNSLRLAGTRCADGHALIASLGAARLGAVTQMDLSGVSTVTDATLAVVAESCPLLEGLWLQCRVDVGPQVSDVGLEDLAACCPRLKELSLGWCNRLTDFTFLALGRDCPALTTLDASFCFQMTDRGLLALLAGCPALTALRLEACDRITEAALVAAAERATGLRTLSLAGCLSGATTAAVMQVGRSCALLTHVDLSGLSGLEDAAVWHLSRGCRWLKELLLAWCVLVSDTGLLQVALNCPLLALLSVRGCARLTDTAVVKLAQNCCYLTELDLRGCELVSQTGLDALAMMLPACTVHMLDKRLPPSAPAPKRF